MTDFAAILAAFADGSCPKEVLADYLEDKGDGRAERVRNEKRTKEDMRLAGCKLRGLQPALYGFPVVVDPPPPGVIEEADWFVRQRILSWFPELLPLHGTSPSTVVIDEAAAMPHL